MLFISAVLSHTNVLSVYVRQEISAQRSPRVRSRVSLVVAYLTFSGRRKSSIDSCSRFFLPWVRRS